MRDTAHLSELEECYYSRLIDQYYIREKALPLDVGQCCRLVRAASAAARRVVASLLGEFFVKSDDGWHQKRCDIEIEAYQGRSASARNSAKARWSERNANASADAMRTHSDGNASQNQKPEPVTRTKEQGQKQRGGKPPPTSKARAAQLPDDWTLPDDWREWAQSERPAWPPEHVLRVSLLFRDYWRGKGEARADWFATWRNWVRRETTPPRVGNAASTLSPAGQQTAENLRNWIATEEAKDAAGRA